MHERTAPRRLPAVFVATDHAIPFDADGSPVPGADDRMDGRLDSGAGPDAWLLRDLDLPALVRIAESRRPMLAVDVDTVEGMNSDAAAVKFLVLGLGVEVVVSRRPSLAVQAVQLGAVGLAHVFAFDSTGLRRSLEGVAGDAGIGVVVSPGLVVPHLTLDDVRRLPRPLVAYGLVDRAEQALALLDIADSVVLRPDVAIAMRAMQRKRAEESGRGDAHAFALDMPADTI